MTRGQGRRATAGFSTTYLGHKRFGLLRSSSRYLWVETGGFWMSGGGADWNERRARDGSGRQRAENRSHRQGSVEQRGRLSRPVGEVEKPHGEWNLLELGVQGRPRQAIRKLKIGE
jgi:hypothetical protein